MDRVDRLNNNNATTVKPPAASGFTGSYELIYHASLSFRAAPVQMLLLDAGIPYTMLEPTWSDDRVIARNAGNHPVFAPPAIRHGDFTLSQTSAIMSFLGEEHGYGAVGAEQKATHLQVILDAADVGSEVFGCAKSREAKGKFAAAEAGGRLKNWLAHFNKIHAKAAASTGGAFLFGGAPTAADFMLLSVFESLAFALGTEAVAAVCPKGLEGWRGAMESRPFYAVFKAQAKPNLFPSMAAGAQ